MTVKVISTFDPWTYDFNMDCYISSDEEWTAHQDYNNGVITQAEYAQVHELWWYGTRNPACPAFDPWRYDSDGDCYISDTEEWVAHQDYNNGVITEAEYTQVHTLWWNHTKNPVCGEEFDPWRYDTNGDCYISDTEEWVAHQDYNSAVITQAQYTQVHDLWWNQTRNPACPEFDPWKYDRDRDCYIRSNEEWDAHQDYMNGFITNAEYTQVHDLYWNHTRNPACPPPECITNADCPADRPYCTEDGKCVECLFNGHCPEGYVCDNGVCVLLPECETDADCPEGYVCRNGKCVKEGAFLWQWLAIGGAAIAGVILLIPKPKKAVKK